MKRIDQIKEISAKTLFTLPAELQAINKNNGFALIFRTLAGLLWKIMLLLARWSLAKTCNEATIQWDTFAAAMIRPFLFNRAN